MNLPSLLNKLRGRNIPSHISNSDGNSLWVFDQKIGLTVMQSQDDDSIIIVPCDMGADTSRLIFQNSNSASIFYNMIAEFTESGYQTYVELNHNEFVFEESPLLNPVSSFSLKINPRSGGERYNWFENVIVDAMEDLQSVIPTLEFGRVEGEVVKTHISRYERDEHNRSACIEFHGTSCKICDFNFEEKYPGLSDGFIHVHHIEQLSELIKPRAFDPRVDLIPVCPNCHAMLHSRKPPLKPDELRLIIKSNNTE